MKTKSFTEKSKSGPMRPQGNKKKADKNDEDSEVSEESESDEDLSGEELKDDWESYGSEDEDVDEDDQNENETDNKEDFTKKSSKYKEDKEHRKSLQKLKKSDPEFYEFLQENDRKLLQFDVSDSESEVSEEDSELQGPHVPPDKLEVASDESDFEPEEGIHTIHGANKVITLQMVEDWQKNLFTDKSVATIGEVMKAFHAAVLRVAAEDDGTSSEYKVTGSSVFNAIIRLCVMYLQSVLRRLLKVSPEATHFQPSKCKKWKKVKTILKGYLTDLLKLLSAVTSEHILSVLLKHNHQMIVFWSAYSSLKKSLVKHLVHLWSKSEDDTVRILSFLCLLRLNSSNSSQKDEDGGTRIYETTLKMMYLAYVQNTKFVSPSTLPAINFMRQSLAEMYALNEAAAYPHVFMYIRQLAIHLRNAITLNKKENLQTVYNWQFVNSLHLWSKLLSMTNEKSPLRPLLYPLVQVAIGTVKLIATAQYFPLRFHIIKMLSQLSVETGVFIPVLPFLIEVLNFNFNKKHTKVSMKPMSFTCVLRLSKPQMQENGFKDAVIESLYDSLFAYLAPESHRIGFPDLVISLCIELKKFIKSCKIANYCKKIKQVLEKIEENVKAIESQRKVTFQIHDQEAILAWETNIKNQGTPLSKFYETWNKLNQQKVAKRATGTDKDDDNIPIIKRPKKTEVDNKPRGPVQLFPSSDESDDNINWFGNFDGEKEEENPKKVKKLKKKVEKPLKTINVKEDDVEMKDTADIVQDLNLSEYE